MLKTTHLLFSVRLLIEKSILSLYCKICIDRMISFIDRNTLAKIFSIKNSFEFERNQ